MNRYGATFVMLVLSLPGCNPAAAQTRAAMLLVSYSGEDKVALISPSTGEVHALLQSGKGPHEITVSHDGAIAYVAISGTGPQGEPGNTITVIDVKQRAVKATFTLTGCRQPHDTRLSRDGTLLWVACGPARAVLELDARTGELRRTFSTNLDGGWFVEVTPDERKLFVPHLEGKAVSVIDRASGKARTVYSGTTQLGLVISPDGREVWVSDMDKHELIVVDATKDEVRGRVSLGTPRQGESTGARMRLTSDGSHVAVVRGGLFLLVNSKSRSVSWTLELPHAGKVLAVSPDDRFVAITHPENNSLSVIDLGARKVQATFPVGKQPDGIAWVLAQRAPRAFSATRVDDERAILESHRRNREAHFKGDVETILANSVAEVVSIGQGKLNRVPKQQTRDLLSRSFAGAVYQEWDDLEPPVVHISADGTMAWLALRVRSRRHKKDAQGVEREETFTFSELVVLEKVDRRWLRVARATTYE